MYLKSISRFLRNTEDMLEKLVKFSLSLTFSTKMKTYIIILLLYINCIVKHLNGQADIHVHSKGFCERCVLCVYIYAWSSTLVNVA